VVIIIIVGAAFGITLINTNTGQAWESRLLWSRSGLDPAIYPYYYADEFQLTTDHIEGSTPPEVHFTIDIDPGSDTETIMTSFTIYDLDVTTFDGLDWTGRNSHELDWAYEDGSYSAILELSQNTGDYTWCIYLYLPTGEKSSTWSCDIEVRLQHYPVY
ncbi:MAG: hypothetical protein ACTSWA_08445, partial [Candidatus Thorarchaeota archaeon]